MSDTPLPLPAGLRWIKLVCRLGVLTHDGVDPDDKPDLLPTVGKVRLASSPARLRVQESDGRWRSVAMSEREYMLRADGELVDAEGRVGVWIPDPASELLDPRPYTLVATVTPTVGERWAAKLTGETLPDVVDLVAHSETVTIPASAVPGLSSRIAAVESILADGGTGGTGGTGGRYVDDEGEMHPFIFVASDTDPGATRVIDGVAYEVWWVQTDPPPSSDPTQWVPAPVTQDVEGRVYTVPVDGGATYTIDGAAKAAGTYAVSPDLATTLEWAAVPKPGYTFKAGAATSGSMVWPEKEWASGDVLMSDSFNRPDGPLIGSMSDSFEGGTPRPWTAVLDPAGAIVSGAATPTGTFFRPDVHAYSTPQDNIRIEWVYATVPGGGSGGFELKTSAGAISVQKSTVYHGGNQGAVNGANTWYTPYLPEPNAGDRLAVYSTTTTEGWRKWTLENLTTGAKVSGVNAPGGTDVLPGDGAALDGSGLKITKITWIGRGNETPVGTLDLVVVKIP